MLDPATVWRVLADPVTLALAVIAAGSILPVARWAAGRYRCSRQVAAGLVASVGAVLVLTGGAGTQAPIENQIPWIPRYLQQLTYNGYIRSELTTILGTTEEIANALLFVPVCLFATLAWRNIQRGLLFGIGLSVFVETIQPLIGRSGSFGDLLHNALGAAVGAMIGFAVLHMIRRRQSSESKAHIHKCD